jgi:peptidoglycan/LPS O-acetylase OafA/YrhL
MLEHYGISSKDNYFNGLFAVRCFFVVSGYLITLSYLRSKNLENFFVKRLKRIYPPILIVAIFALFFGILRCSGERWFISIFNFLTFQNLKRPEVYNFETFSNPPFWTLAIEFQFYLLLPLILFFWKKNKKAGYFSLAILYLLPCLLKVSSPDQSTVIFFYLEFFTAGIVLALIEKEHPYFLQKNVRWIAPPSFLVVALIAFNVWHDNHLFANLFFPICLALTAIFFANYLSYFFGKTCFFGDLSYGIYIYHWVVMDMWQMFAPKLSSSPNRLYYLISTTVFLAFISWHFIEKRFLKPSLSRK